MFGRGKGKRGIYGYKIHPGCDCQNCAPEMREKARAIVHSEHLSIFNCIHPGSWSAPSTARPGYKYVQMTGSRKGPSMKNPEPPKRKLDGGVRLFRAWCLRGTSLCSLSANYTWKQGYNQSGKDNILDYANIRSYNAIYDDTSLRSLVSDFGFYGFRSYQYALGDVPSNGYVFGTIVCWGWVVVAEHGCRCQYAKVESLIDPYSSKEMESSLNILAAAEKYSAQVISPDTAHNLAGGLIPYRREQ